MLMTKADLPFTKEFSGYLVLFELDDFGSAIATCQTLPGLRIRSPVVEHAVREASSVIAGLHKGHEPERYDVRSAWPTRTLTGSGLN